ncbi:MAG: hypothetical protein Alpg2KO_09440 [Alphaproteobacteria bacterium]
MSHADASPRLIFKFRLRPTLQTSEQPWPYTPSTSFGGDVDGNTAGWIAARMAQLDEAVQMYIEDYPDAQITDVNGVLWIGTESEWAHAARNRMVEGYKGVRHDLKDATPLTVEQATALVDRLSRQRLDMMDNRDEPATPDAHRP